MHIAVKEKLTAAFFVCLCFLLQTGVASELSVRRIMPELVLVCTILYGWMRGQHSAMFCGFFGGLFVDVFFTDVLGLHALIYVYAGFLGGFFHRYFDEHEHRIPLLMIPVGDLAVLLIRFLLFDVLYGNFHLGRYLVSRALPEMVTTFLAGLLLYPVLLWIEIHFVQVSKKRKDMDDWDLGAGPDGSGTEGIG